MGYSWLITARCGHHVFSMQNRAWDGRRGAYTFSFHGLFVVWFPLTLHGSVVRCQSTSSHGACRRLTVDQPNFRLAIDVHHTITCPFSIKLALLCTPVEYLKAFVHLQTGRQLSLGMERPTFTIQPREPVPRPKGSMHRYRHASMTSTISHAMKTSCKSTNTMVPTRTN